MDINTIALILSVANSILIGLIAVLRAWSPKTQTTLDDQLVAGYDKLKEMDWVTQMYPLFWSAVEATSKLPDTNPVFKGIKKLDAYLLQLREAYKVAFNRDLSQEGQQLAAKLAEAASQAAKLNPQPAQASK